MGLCELLGRSCTGDRDSTRRDFDDPAHNFRYRLDPWPFLLSDFECYVVTSCDRNIKISVVVLPQKYMCVTLGLSEKRDEE